MKEAAEYLETLGRPRIMVLGDLILDIYIQGDVKRISPEAPILVFQGGERIYKVGGAGNVAANLNALEADVIVSGVTGKDWQGRKLVSLFEDAGIPTDGILETGSRPTTTKTRFLSRDHQILRWDEEVVEPVAGRTKAYLIRYLEKHIPGCDALILSDYGKGILTEEILDFCFSLCRKASVVSVVDPKGRNFAKYRGATVMTPNQAEAETATGMELGDERDLERAGDKLLEELLLDIIVITLGKRGIFFKTRDGRKGLLPARARAVYDVTGAGDTVAATLGFCMAGEMDIETSLRICNIAAGIVVGKLGAATVTRDEIIAEAKGSHDSGKIIRRQDIKALAAGLKKKGKKVVFTNGCFDILHVGHIEFLKTAKNLGDVLVVGVNDDASVKRLKGNTRPVFPLADRMNILAALEMTDFVVPFSEDTPERIIRDITPDVLVKGEDWKDMGVVGREWVESHGGTVVLVPLVPGRSTTGTIEKLKEGGKD